MNKDACLIMEEYRFGNKEKAEKEMYLRLSPLIDRTIKKCCVPPSMTEDAFQEGALAILEEMKRYDPNISSPETFFPVYILHRITRYLHRNIYHSSIDHSRRLKKVAEIKSELEEEGRHVNVREIAKSSGLKEKDVEKTLMHLNRVQQERHKSEEEKEPKDECHDTETTALKNIEKERLYAILNRIGEKNKDIISMKYGLNGYSPSPVRIISEKYHVPSSQIRGDIEKSMMVIKFLFQQEYGYLHASGK